MAPEPSSPRSPRSPHSPRLFPSPWNSSPCPSPARQISSSTAKTSMTSMGSLNTEEWDAQENVPVEFLWVFLQRQKRRGYFFKFITWAIFVAIFTVITQMLRPVRATFTVQDSLLQHTAYESFNGSFSSWPKTFYDISSDADWWEWVESVLLPNILSDKYFNGDPRAAIDGNRFLNTVSMYNTQTAPVRFRQARVKDNSCDTPADISQLPWACWGDFSGSRQFKQAFGQSYGNRFLTNLNNIGGSGVFGIDYGTEAHVVDVPLNSTATKIVADMKKGPWLNEQTRAISIETNWYNANLDLSTYLMLHIGISPGGRFRPCVVIHSCRLFPYSTNMDYVRGGIEAVFAVMVACFCIGWFRDLRRAVDKKAYWMSCWNLLELANILSLVFILLCWAVFITKDKKSFEVLTSTDYNGRPDLSGLAAHFNLGSNFAVLSLIFSYVKLFKCAQLFSSLELLWRALELAAGDMGSFLVIFLLCTSGFTFIAHWLFGFTMIEFHNWGQSFTTLFQSLMGGLPYEEMSQAAPISTALFTLAWVLLMCMIFSSMFIAILTQWYLQLHEQNSQETLKLAQEVGPHANDGFFKIFLRSLRRPRCCCRRSNSDEARFQNAAREAQKAFRQGNFTDSEWIRKAAVSGAKVQIRDIRRHFQGDDEKAYNFVKKVCALAEMESESMQGSVRPFQDKPEVEGQERGRLQKLQATVGRLESDLKHLRGSLNDSYTAHKEATKAIEI